MGIVAASTAAIPEGTYFSAQNSGPYSATNMSSPMMARLRHCWSVGCAWPLTRMNSVKHNAGGEEARPGRKQRRQLLDRDADGEKGRSPEEVDGKE